jgi:tripartite-type tricarboxylate transporter receptor subunit TctC
LYATAGTPVDVISKLSGELMRVVSLLDVQTKLRDLGGELGSVTREQLAVTQCAESERFGKLIRDAVIKLVVFSMALHKFMNGKHMNFLN